MDDETWEDRMRDELHQASRKPRTTGWWPDSWWRRLIERYPRG